MTSNMESNNNRNNSMFTQEGKQERWKEANID